MTKKRAMLLGLDGADPMVVKRLIGEGRMPNLKKVLEQGAATENLDMLGVFPTVTPPNWTTLATGNYPRTHGITCFNNHTLGKSLSITEMNWDSRRIESELIWEAFEDEDKRCIMLNYCQAWPNRVKGSKNIFVDGTGVIPFIRSGAEFQKIVHLDNSLTQMKEVPHFVTQNTNDCVVYGDQVEEFSRPEADGLLAKTAKFHFEQGDVVVNEETPLMEMPAFVVMDESVEAMSQSDVIDRIYSPIKEEPKNWGFELPDEAKEAVFPMNKGLARRYAILSASDGKKYDTITFYANKKTQTPMGTAKPGEWSDWLYDQFNINNKDCKVAYKVRVLDISEDGSKAKFYVSHVMNMDNDTYFYPKELGHELFEAVGPMQYFATFDRHTEVGDQVYLESWKQMHDWEIAATKYLFEKYGDWQLFYIHLHSIDLANHHYINQAIPESHPDWKRHHEVIDRIYEINDEYIGAMMEYLDDNTTMFVVSDHGATPRAPGYENPGIGELSGINGKVLSQLGYTSVIPINKEKGLWDIDWTKTKAISQRTSHIYINLKGRDPEGIVEPEEYDALVQQIISDLYAYRDPVHGDRVVAFAMTREEMESVGMGGPHCGDIFFQLNPNFQLEHANCPNHVSNFDYSVGCLCVMAGAGIKKGETITRPIRAVDIVPTICEIVRNRMPKNVEGGVIYQALDK